LLLSAPAIGVLLLDEEGNAVLENYVNGEITSLGTLIQRLEVLYGD
jgi:hypothetical protein